MGNHLKDLREVEFAPVRGAGSEPVQALRRVRRP